MYQKKTCPTCKCEHRNPKFCSLACQQEGQYRLYVERWLKGEETGGSSNGVSKYVRRYLIEIRGEKCEVCNWNEAHPITGRIPIEVHHRNDSSDHSIDNLMLLCPNHHSLTPSFRALNKGKGRSYRRI